MIEKDELRILQTRFEGNRKEYMKEYRQLEKLRNQFTKKFSKDDIKKMSLQHYVVGHKDKNSFCYWLEFRLMGLGKLKGSFSDKMFGLYFSAKNQEYIAIEKYRKGRSIEEAFETIKQAIYDLLIAGDNQNIDEIKGNDISPMFKGKILATYFPKLYLSIFSEEHLDYFLDCLKIYYNNHDIIDKRMLMMDFKNNDQIMKKWNNHLFMKFIYDSFGYPPFRNDSPEELHEYLDIITDYPDLKDVNPTSIDFQILPTKLNQNKRTKSSIKKIDFERENRIKQKLGKRGEEIVMKFERIQLVNKGKDDLADKIKWVSLEDDSLGYDIISFTENGEKKYIEVKATTNSPSSNVSFIISRNQYEVSKKLNNYYFYIIFNAKDRNPKIWKLKNPLGYENKGLNLKPTKYRVNISAKELK